MRSSWFPLAALLVLAAPAQASQSQNEPQTRPTSNRVAAELLGADWTMQAMDGRLHAVLADSDADHLLRIRFWGRLQSPLNGLVIAFNADPSTGGLKSVAHDLRIVRQDGPCVTVAGKVWARRSVNRGEVLAGGETANSVSEVYCASSTVANLRDWQIVGRWRTPLGELNLQAGRGAILTGHLSRPDSGGVVSPYRRISLAPASEHSEIGGWSPMDGEVGGPLALTLVEGDRLQGRIGAGSGASQTFMAERITDPAEEPASPTPAPSPVTTPSSPAPAGGPVSAGFEPLSGFEVRFEGLERPRGAGAVRAVVTIRNASQKIQYLPSGTFRAILTDTDGAGQERNQLWRGSGEPAQLFNGTPTLQPGGELTVRFVFNPDTPQLRSLTLMQGTEQVDFDLGGA